MLEFAEQHSTEKDVSGQQLGVNLSLLLKIATAIYGDVGAPQATPVFACNINKEGKLRITATNHSAWHASRTLKGYVAGTITPVFTVHAEIYRDSISDIDTNWLPTTVESIHLTWQNDNETQIHSTTCQLPPLQK
jgi:hypothetical protein